MSLTLIGTATASSIFSRMRRVRGATVAATVALVLLAIAAVAADWVTPHDPDFVDLANVFAGPNLSHPLGFDANGRDLLSRLIVGARTAIIGPMMLVALSTLAGVALALVGAWYGGLMDTLISRLLDILLAFPGLLIAIVAASVFGPSLTTAALALSISYIPFIGRVVRSEALRHRKLAYVHEAWLQGMSAPRICFTQILPNLAPIIIAQVVISLSYAVIDLTAMSYLGLGVQPPTADWGAMIAIGQESVLQGHPGESIAASLCIVALVLALGVLGNAQSERARDR